MYQMSLFLFCSCLKCSIECDLFESYLPLTATDIILHAHLPPEDIRHQHEARRRLHCLDHLIVRMSSPGQGFPGAGHRLSAATQPCLPSGHLDRGSHAVLLADDNEMGGRQAPGGLVLSSPSEFRSELSLPRFHGDARAVHVSDQLELGNHGCGIYPGH